MENLIMTYISAGVVLKQNSKFLLVQERSHTVYGLWGLPSGRVAKGESIEEAAIREAKEETGYSVELIQKLGIWQKDVTQAPQHTFKAKITGGRLRIPKQELLNVKWLKFNEIRSMKNKLRSDWVLDAISLSEKKCKKPDNLCSQYLF